MSIARNRTVFIKYGGYGGVSDRSSGYRRVSDSVAAAPISTITLSSLIDGRVRSEPNVPDVSVDA